MEIVGGILLALLIPALTLKFTIVREGTAKAVMKLGEFERIIFRWKNHFMDEENNIWEEEDWKVVDKKKGIREKKEEENEEKINVEKKRVTEMKVKGRIFGGLFFVGIRGIHSIHKYDLRWTDFRQTEEAGKTVFRLQFHEEKNRSFVMLKPAVYGIELEGVETRPPERIAVTVQIPVTMRVVNPEKFLFVAPPTPLEDVLVKLSALMRERITMSIMDELLTLQGRAEEIWEGWQLSKEAAEILGIQQIIGMKDEKLITDTLPKWGLRVAKQGIAFQSITPPKDIQEAMTEKRKQDMLAEARAGEIMGSIISSEAVARGRSEGEIQKEIDQDSLRQKEVWETGKELVLKKLAMESGSYVHGDFPQGTSLESLITLIKWMPMGRLPEAEEKPEVEAPPGEASATLDELVKKAAAQKITEEELKMLARLVLKLPLKERAKIYRQIPSTYKKAVSLFREEKKERKR